MVSNSIRGDEMHVRMTSIRGRLLRWWIEGMERWAGYSGASLHAANNPHTKAIAITEIRHNWELRLSLPPSTSPHPTRSMQLDEDPLSTPSSTIPLEQSIPNYNYPHKSGSSKLLYGFVGPCFILLNTGAPSVKWELDM